MSTVKPYLQLVRLPNLFTAAADSLAGWLLVEGSLREPGRWLPLVFASLVTYAGGIVLNDVFDYEVDLRERPKRPLPSGRVDRRLATGFAIGCLAAGLLLAALAGPRALLVEVALVAAVLAYDAGAKRTVVGPAVMGGCRGLNLVLGLSASATFGGLAGGALAVSYAAFVAGITWISRSEVAPVGNGSTGRALGMVVQNAALIGYLAVSLHPEWFDPHAPDLPFQKAAGVGLLLVLAVLINRRSILALASTDPAVVQAAVKVGILALVWLHVGALLAIHGPLPALAVAWLWFPAILTGRWIYST